MNVAHVIIGLTMGGAEKIVVDLCAKSVKDKKVRMFVVSITEDMDRKPDLESLNIPLLCLRVKKSVNSVLNGIRQLRQYLIEKEIDVIHAHMTHAYFISMFSSFGTNIPIVFTGHNTNLGSKWREFFLYTTKSFRKFDIIFEKDQIRYFHKKNFRSVTIPNGILINQILEKQHDLNKFKIFTFINIGNLEHQKNQLFLINTANILKSDKVNFQILIIGEGSKKEILNQKIKQSNLGNFVKLLGKRTDVPELLGRSHCFILPSHWEGMPLTILEAGVSGIPVIATPVGNIPQILNKDRGYISSLNNFAQAMKYVMDQYPLALEKADNLKRFVTTHFSMDHVYNKHIELYQKVIKS